MRQIAILLTSDIEGGLHPFVHDDLAVQFHQWNGQGPLPLLTGRVLAFVEWNMPTISGAELCRRLRCDRDYAAAYITTVLDQEHAEDRRRAIRAGANECIVGPLSRTAILDRVLTLPADEVEKLAPTSLKFGELVIDSAAFLARWRGQILPIMPNEFRLLRFLVEHPGRVFTRTQLIEALGKRELPIDERTVDVWIGRLRRALKALGAGNPLRTVRGLGYVLDLPSV